MLDLPRYLLGCLELSLLVGFAALGASALRARLLPSFTGPPAWLATGVLTLALFLWTAELLGTFGAFELLPYLAINAVVGVGLSTLLRGWRGDGVPRASVERVRGAPRRDRTRGQSATIPMPSMTTIAGFAIAAIALGSFAADARPQLGAGMTGFDSTWYHGPFAAGFFQSGDTWDLHLIAPQFLAWFYPANSELAHAVGMLAFDRDLLSPLLNIGWLAGCLVALWCIGRPYGVGLFTLVLGAIALRLPAFADQAGEARNDIVGTFFLLAAVALAVNLRPPAARAADQARERTYSPYAGQTAFALVPVGLAAGLAAGTKLNFLLPAGVLVAGMAAIAPRGARLRALAVTGLSALAGGGYWYLRNLAHSGNPLPWVRDLGPISLPAPDQALGGREGHSVFGYLTDGTVWADWLLPGLRDGLGPLFPLIGALAAAGLILCLISRTEPPLRVAAAVGLATAIAWLVAPTSASGPEGIPRGFESGLRYLIPAFTLGLALLPLAPPLRERLATLSRRGMGNSPDGRILKVPSSGRHLSGRGIPHAPIAILVVLAAVAIGYPVQRHYLEGRYADPSFTTPGLNAAFEWSRSVSDSRIATTSTRQYPLFGTDLSNRVEFVGAERPHGGFVAPVTCPQWRRLLNDGDYDYVIASRDRIDPEQPPYPATARWTEGPEAKVILRKPPTVIFQLRTPLDVSACTG